MGTFVVLPYGLVPSIVPVVSVGIHPKYTLLYSDGYGISFPFLVSYVGFAILHTPRVPGAL